MEPNERAVLDPSEVNTGFAGEMPTAKDGQQEHASDTRNFVGADAPEGAKKQDHEGPLPAPSEAAASSGNIESENTGVLENSFAIATHFANSSEFRSATADATPPPTSLRARSRGRNQVLPTKFVAAGVGEDPVPGASSSSAPAATGVHEDGDQRDAPVDDKKLKRACSAPGATVAIAHASPPDSYRRRMPSRSRKQYSPKRFVAVPNGGQLLLPASLGSALPPTSASAPRTATSGVTDALAPSSSKRPPSRGRKQPRPEHFIPEEAEASASAKARRSDIVLDRFLSSLVHGSSASDSVWVRNVTAEDATVRNQRGGDCFRIRDASRHAARGIHAAISRLGASRGGPCSCTSASAPGSPPGEPDGRGRFYGVLAVLGASLVLSVASCVLFYIVGQRSDAGPSGEKQDK